MSNLLNGEAGVAFQIVSIWNQYHQSKIQYVAPVIEIL